MNTKIHHKLHSKVIVTFRGEWDKRHRSRSLDTHVILYNMTLPLLLLLFFFASYHKILFTYLFIIIIFNSSSSRETNTHTYNSENEV